MDYLRQRDIFDPDQHHAAATIVGCGGIGSFTAVALAKLGVERLALVDFDTVEEHNLPNQMFMSAHVGLAKPTALADTIDRLAPTNIAMHKTPLQDGVPLNPIIISALDSMHARKDLWQQVKMKFRCKLFLDARLGGQNVLLYAVNPMNRDDIAGYEATLHSDAEGMDLPCTGRAIIDVGFVVASLITRAVRRHYTLEPVDRVTYLNQETLHIAKGEWL